MDDSKLDTSDNTANVTSTEMYGLRVLNLNLGQRRAFKSSITVANVLTVIIGADSPTHHGLLVSIKEHSLLDKITNIKVTGQLLTTTFFSVTIVDQSSNLSPFKQRLRKYVNPMKPILILAVSHSSRTAYHMLTSGPPAAERPRRLTGEKLQAPPNKHQENRKKERRDQSSKDI